MKKTQKTQALVVMKQELPIETKLSRSEIIDLLIESMERDLDAEIESLSAELAKLSVVEYDDIKDLVASGKFQLSFTWTDKNKHGRRAHIQLSNLIHDARFTEREKAYSTIDHRIIELRQLRADIRENRSKAKNAILRKFLEGTEEGKNVLKQLDTFRASLQARFLEEVSK